MEKRLLGGLTKKFKFQYQPLGFSWMIFADRNDFDRQHYDFHYARREFLGDVRCLVFDLTPKKDAGRGRFLGRIWVEDQDFTIVRLNGTYAHPSRNSYYFHMDSWRLNLVPGYWVRLTSTAKKATSPRAPRTRSRSRRRPACGDTT
jgi:hypothetical protein